MDVWRSFRLLSGSKSPIGLAVYNDVMVFYFFPYLPEHQTLLVEVFSIGGSIN